MVHKLKNQRGETLVEVMASVVIAALSVALLFGCVMASSQLDHTAQKADNGYYDALSKAEQQSVADKVTLKDASGNDITVKVKMEGNGTSKDFTINLFGGENMYSYKKG